MPDSLPPMAAAVQDRLKLENAGAYGIDSCCSSFITMVEIASSLVRCGVKKCVLVVGSHLSSHVLDRSEYCCVRLGDGAVAGVVAPVEDDAGYVASYSTADGSVHDAVLMIRRPPSLMRETLLGRPHEQYLVTFANAEACKQIAVNSNEQMLRMASGLFAKAGISASDVDFFVTHQPVDWAGDAWRKALGIPAERFHQTFERYGNVGTCCCGINLAEALEQKRIRAGDLLLMASSGAGENHIGLLERVTSRLVQSAALA
jgi:3-oxoacyl-[acyl-carrier-protein] synthase III